jgi:hypothetical protein
MAMIADPGIPVARHEGGGGVGGGVVADQDLEIFKRLGKHAFDGLRKRCGRVAGRDAYGDAQEDFLPQEGTIDRKRIVGRVLVGSQGSTRAVFPADKVA